MYILHREQIVQTSLKTAWELIQDPTNLNDLSPAFLQFKIISPIPKMIYNGLIVEYKIRIPYLGWRRWVAEIKHIREPYSFVDEQRIGPYPFWYHYHELAETDDGIRMVDTLYYQMPFSVIGKMIHFLIVKKILGQIFDYKHKKFAEILGK